MDLKVSNFGHSFTRIVKQLLFQGPGCPALDVGFHWQVSIMVKCGIPGRDVSDPSGHVNDITLRYCLRYK